MLSLTQLDINFDFYNQVDYIHRLDDSKSFITLFKKGFKSNFHRHYKLLPDLKDKIQDFFINNNNFDLYMSLNTFFKPERTLESLRYINALYIDLDTYKTGFSKTQILMNLEDNYFNKLIPRPSLIIDSGRGLNLVWRIEPVPSKALKLWKALMYKFYNELKVFGADGSALDPTRVLRVVGSINSKTNTEVRVLESYDYIYSLKELKYEYLPEVIKKEKNKNKKDRKIIKFFTPYSLEIARIEDLEKLCEIRNYSLEGCREYLLFYYRYLLCRVYDPEYALEKTIELNNKFVEPLKLSEVIHDTKSGERYSLINKYKFTNNKLIEIFSISEDEQRILKSIHSKKIKYEINNEKRKSKRRNDKGLTNREQAKFDKLKTIYNLMLRNFSNSEISDKLNISVRQVQRYKKEIKSIDIDLFNNTIEENLSNEFEKNTITDINYNRFTTLKNKEVQSLFVVPKYNTSKSIRKKIYTLKYLFKGS